ncbi:efflux RND transporter periplasmic adaptor subunit [Hymenobacter sp. B1770]|uniref:efflux RND transporter periplasmic adaptor subunit n=1 Tax=Hymenobacter sp. B1770 TaxID=1718788 RepID=UPI003CF9EB7B
MRYFQLSSLFQLAKLGLASAHGIKWSGLALAAALLAGGLLPACQSKGETAIVREVATNQPIAKPGELTISPAQFAAAGIETGSFTYKNMTSDVQANGVVDVPPQNHVSISAVMGGYVQQVRVLPGQQVRKGAVIAVLRHPDYLKLQQEYLQARARLQFLRQELQRQQTLEAEDVGAKRKLQQAQSEFQNEQATKSSLASQLRLLGLSPERLRATSLTPSVSLTTPIGGYVKAVNINPGQFVNPQDVLVEVVDRSGLHLELKVFEKDIARVQKGQRVLFKVPNSGQNQELEAEVFLVGQAFEDDARTVRVHAHLHKPSATLLPGQYVAAHIQTAGARHRTLPEDAVIQAGEQSYIFARQGSVGSHRFRRYQVQTGATQNGDVVITPLEALPDTTQLVRRGAYFLEAELNKGREE